MTNISGNPNWIVTDEAVPKKIKKVKKKKIDEKLLKDIKLRIEKNLVSTIKDAELFYEECKDKNVSDLLIHLRTANSINEKIEILN